MTHKLNRVSTWISEEISGHSQPVHIELDIKKGTLQVLEAFTVEIIHDNTLGLVFSNDEGLEIELSWLEIGMHRAPNFGDTVTITP